MTQESNFLENMFQGTVMPMQRPRQRNKPVLEEKKIIESGNNFTQVKVYVHSPTLQFPTTGIFLQLNNAKGSCFMRFEDVSDLESLSEWLREVASKATSAVEQLKPLEIQVSAQLNQYSEAVNAIKRMQGEGGIEQ